MQQIFTFSESGGHTINEDAFATGAHPEDPTCRIVVIADGQGGRAGGREAAQLACRVALESAQSYSTRKLVRPKSWQAILRASDRAVCDSPDAGFSTLVAACIVESKLCGASSGDSAAMLMNGSQQRLKLTARQIKNPPVGSGAAEFVPFTSHLIEPWLILLMTDGVWKYVGWPTIESLITQKDPQSAIEALKESARLPGSGAFQDDFTVMAVRSGAIPAP